MAPMNLASPAEIFFLIGHRRNLQNSLNLASAFWKALPSFIDSILRPVRMVSIVRVVLTWPESGGEVLVLLHSIIAQRRGGYCTYSSSPSDGRSLYKLTNVCQESPHAQTQGERRSLRHLKISGDGDDRVIWSSAYCATHAVTIADSMRRGDSGERTGRTWMLHIFLTVP